MFGRRKTKDQAENLRKMVKEDMNHQEKRIIRLFKGMYVRVKKAEELMPGVKNRSRHEYYGELILKIKNSLEKIEEIK